MGTPSQIRSVDPYASFNSNSINPITRVVSNGDDCILASLPIKSTKLSDTVITCSPGKCIKDDVLIEILSELNVDFTNALDYVSSDTGYWNENGYYYLVLEYNYVKAKPVPEASIKIIQPDQRTNPAFFNVSHLLLKVVHVSGNVIDELLNYDPEHPEVQVRFSKATRDAVPTVLSESSSLAPDDTLVYASNTIDIMLPPLSLYTQQSLKVIKIDVADTAVTLIAYGADTINGEHSVTLVDQYSNIELIPDLDTSSWIMSTPKSLPVKSAVVTSDYEVGVTDDLIFASGNITITLPYALEYLRPSLQIFKTDSNATTVTIASKVGDTINGAPTAQLKEQFESMTLVTNSINLWMSVMSSSAEGNTAYPVADYNISNADSLVVAPGNIVLTLPYSDQFTKPSLKIIKSDPAETILTINAQVGENIIGKVTITLQNQYESLTLIPDGLDTWFVDSNMGSMNGTEASVSSNYNVKNSDDRVSTIGNLTLTLPPSGTYAQEELMILKTDSNATTVTIAAYAGDTIDGMLSMDISNQFTAIELIADGTNTWYIVSNSEALLGSTGTTANVSANYNILNTDTIVSATGDTQLTLPLADGFTQESLKIIKKDSNLTTLTIVPQGGETIDGKLSVIMHEEYDSITLMSDGGDLWTVVYSNITNPSNSVNVSANYAMTDADRVISTSNTITITLCDAATFTQSEVRIVKTDNNLTTLSIVPQVGQTIDGLTNVTLSDEFNNVTLVSNGLNLWTIAATNVVKTINKADTTIDYEILSTDDIVAGSDNISLILPQAINYKQRSLKIIKKDSNLTSLEILVPGIDHCNVISGGDYYSAIIKDNGTLWTWGLNNYGQLGDGSTANRSTPVQIGSESWSKVKCGLSHTLAIKVDGTMWSWGANDSGQLGDGTTISKSSPIQIGSDNTWSDITLGHSSNQLAIKTDGTMWVWGFGLSSPVQLGSDTDWSSVNINNGSIDAIKTDGTLWAWGSNTYGQVGDGTNVDVPAPVQIGILTDWVKSINGMFSTVALKSDGTLWSWGSGSYGQLGNGSTSNISSPVQIGSDTDWALMSTKEYSVFAIKTDGTLWAWGKNNVGQLGDGTTVDKSTPVQIGISNNWIQISCGYNHTLMTKTDKNLNGIGANDNGELGTGTLNSLNKVMPVGLMQTIEGQYKMTLTEQYQSVSLVSLGSDLWVEA